MGVRKDTHFVDAVDNREDAISLEMIHQLGWDDKVGRATIRLTKVKKSMRSMTRLVTNCISPHAAVLWPTQLQVSGSAGGRNTVMDLSSCYGSHVIDEHEKKDSQFRLDSPACA